MKAIFIADIHIKLGQRNVPREWQKNRMLQLAEELPESDLLIIAGDLLDTAKPSLEEVGLMYEFLSVLKPKYKTDILLIPGNHEMETKSRDCYSNIEEMLLDLHVNVIQDFTTLYGFDFIPYNIIKNEWPTPQSKLAVTHVRGEIPPHVKPEIPLEKFSAYKKVFTGDLHSHKNSQRNLYYPGSPVTTSFHRSESSGANGYFTIDTETGEHTWTELFLPQLIRLSVTDPSDMIPTPYHHTIYEIEGDLADLATVGKSELLDKKVVRDVSTPATLDLKGNIGEELELYFQKIHELKTDAIAEILTEFKETTGED